MIETTKQKAKIGILTLSDRASAGIYEGNFQTFSKKFLFLFLGVCLASASAGRP